MDNIVNITSLPLTPGQSDPRTWQKMKVNPNTRSKETIQPRGTIRSMGTHTIISNILVGKEEYNSMDIIAILNPKKRLHLQRKLASRSQNTNTIIYIPETILSYVQSAATKQQKYSKYSYTHEHQQA